MVVVLSLSLFFSFLLGSEVVLVVVSFEVFTR
jgi:hypothetical protein